MNKKIKKIIAIALTVSAFGAFTPISNVMTTQAYASTKSSDATLDDISLSDGDISFHDDKSSYSTSVKSSEDEVTVRARPSDSDAKVTIDGKTVDSDDDWERKVDLKKGSNSITIRVKSEDGNHTKSYTVHIRRGYSSSDEDSDNNAYLDDLSLNEGKDISFSKTDYSYHVNVDSDVDEIKITAEPYDSDDTVRIDGSSVDSDDDWEKEVDLKKGSNKIEVKVEDDDTSKTRTYTLYINRGYSSGDSSDRYLNELSVEGNDISLSNDKSSYDITTKDYVGSVTVRADLDDTDNNLYINGSKVYNSDDYEKKIDLNKGKNAVKIEVKDALDKSLKSYTLNIYRGQDTVPSTTTNANTNTNTTTNNTQTAKKINQWEQISGVNSYYYYDENGNKTTGWKQIGPTWYLFDSNGIMLKGWQQVGANWYFMYDNGAMAQNTTINGWYVNSDGAWVNK